MLSFSAVLFASADSHKPRGVQKNCTYHFLFSAPPSPVPVYNSCWVISINHKSRSWGCLSLWVQEQQGCLHEPCRYTHDLAQRSAQADFGRRKRPLLISKKVYVCLRGFSLFSLSNEPFSTLQRDKISAVSDRPIPRKVLGIPRVPFVSSVYVLCLV